MTHAIELKQSQLSGIRHFQKFVFINDLSLESIPGSTQQLQIASNSQLLSQAKVGNWLKINRLQVPKQIIDQLDDLQFKPEKRVRLVSKTAKSSVIVELNGKLIGIGAEIAQKIVVTLVDETKL